MTRRSFGRYVVEISNEDKVLFPGDGLTKGDLVVYYAEIAKTMLPHVRGRPVSMLRFPDGIDGDGFYQKDAPDYFPAWIERVRAEKEGGTVDHVVCGRTADLAYLANQGCITPHVWLSRKGALEHPDLVVFDFDPSTEGFGEVRFAARAARDLLEELGLAVYVQTTGSRGLHVVVPIRAEEGFDRVRAFARDVAKVLSSRAPERLTTEQYKNKRGDRVYIDTGRNAYAQTFAPPYSVRPKPGAPVATPIDWDEVGGVTPRKYNILNVLRRLGQKGDPWSGMRKHARSLGAAWRRLEVMGGDG